LSSKGALKGRFQALEGQKAAKKALKNKKTPFRPLRNFRRREGKLGMEASFASSELDTVVLLSSQSYLLFHNPLINPR
jgi:hypothetical protein